MIEFLLYILLPLSIVLNVLTIYYCIVAAKKLMISSSNFEAMGDIISSFKDHVEKVHQSEMFYGDQTLQNLMQHSQVILEELEKHEDLDTLVLYEQEEEDFEEEETT